jgi:hypothetical protein
MSQKFINIGSTPNDSTGDPLRTAFDKINQNFNEVYSNVAGSNFKFQVNTMTTNLGNITISPLGSAVIVGTNNQLYLQGTAASTSTSTGTLVVNGGVGIAGDLHIGGYFVAPYASFSQIQNTPIGTITPALGSFTTLTATDLSVSNSVSINNTLSVINNFSAGSVSTGVLTATSVTAGSGSGTFQNLYSIESIFSNAFVNGLTAINLLTSNAYITGGTISGVSISINGVDNTPIGATTPNTAVFTKMTTANAQITGGNISGVTLNVTALNSTPIGNSIPSTGVFTNVTTSNGGQHIGYHTGAIGANVANTGVFTNVTTSNGGQHIGYHTGAIGANVANSGAFTTVTTIGNLTTANVAVNGNLSTNYLIANTITTTAGLGGNLIIDPDGSADLVISPFTEVYIQSTAGSNSTSNGSLIVSGGVGVAGNVYVGGQLVGYHTGAIGANVANTGVFTNVTTSNGGQLVGYHTGAIGANVANSGAFTEVTISGNLIASNFTIIGNISGSAATAVSATTSGTATYATTAGLAGSATTVVQPYQGNITGTGTLANLFVTSTATVGNLTTSGNITATGNITTGQTFYAGTINVGNVRVTGGNLNIYDSYTIDDSRGSPGDIKGKIVWSNNYIYVCGADYTGADSIWFRANLNSF